MYNEYDMNIALLCISKLSNIFGDINIGKSKNRDDYYTRYICMYILRTLGFKYNDIANVFNTTHATVIYAYKLIKYEVITNKILDTKINYAICYITDNIINYYNNKLKGENYV